MKKNKITKHLKPLVSLLMISLPFILSSQNLAEVEGTTEIKMNSTTGSPHLRLIEDDFSSGGTTRMAFQHSDNMSDEFELRAYLSSSTDKRIGFSFNNNFRVVWNETDDGFGIGTSQPESKFHVLDNSSGSKPTALLEESQDNDFARLFFRNANNTNDRWALSSNTGTTDDHLFGFYYNGSPRLIYNETDGGLGIGTDSPDEILDVVFSGFNGLKLDGDGTGDARIWINNDAGNHFIFDDASDSNTFKISAANDLAVSTNGNERLRVLELNGEVGINGGENVNRRLGVQTTNDLYGIYMDQNSSGTATGMYASTESNGTSTKYGIQGNIGGTTGSGSAYGVRGFASTTPSNFWALYASGDIWYTGSMKAPSDIRLKKNIEDIEPVLNKVMQLETKTYEFDRETYDYANLANGKQHGFIAQNVQNLFPDLVEEERHVFVIGENEETGEPIEKELNILGMSNIEMIPILTKAIQEQQALIEELRSEIDQLKSEK